MEKLKNKKELLIGIAIGAVICLFVVALAFVLSPQKEEPKVATEEVKNAIVVTKDDKASDNGDSSASSALKEDAEAEANGDGSESDRTNTNNMKPTIDTDVIIEAQKDQETSAGKKAEENIAKVATDAAYVGDLKKEDFKPEENLKEMSTYWEEGNMAAVTDLVFLPRFLWMSNSLKGTAKFYYYGPTNFSGEPNGKGIACYAQNQYYYGEFKDGKRSGEGTWINYFRYNTGASAEECLLDTHSYTGQWDNDLPNGQGSEHYDFIFANMTPDTRYNQNFIGGFRNGLYDGEMYVTDTTQTTDVKEWKGICNCGDWEVKGDPDKYGRYPVLWLVENEDSYQWIPKNKLTNCGVVGIITGGEHAE